MLDHFADFRGTPVSYRQDAPITWRVSIYVLVVRNGSVLFMEPTYSEFLELPGGGVNVGEPLLAAARRECWEETGYRFELGEAVPVFVGEGGFFDDGSYHHALRFVVRGSGEPDLDPTWTPIPDETKRVL